MPEEKPAQVVVANVQMEFFSMVVFMVKWALACIPAAIILWMIATTLCATLLVGSALVTGFVTGITGTAISAINGTE